MAGRGAGEKVRNLRDTDQVQRDRAMPAPPLDDEGCVHVVNCRRQPTAPNLRRDASTSAIMAGRVHCRCHLVRWPPPGHPRSCYRGRPVAQLTASWVWATCVGSGVVCLIFSWVTRQPVMVRRTRLGACTRQVPGCQINGNRCGTRCWIRRAGGWVAAVVRTARCRSRRSALDQACRTSWTANHRRSHRRVCRFRQQQLRPTRRGRARG